MRNLQKKNKMEDKSAIYVEFKRHLVDSRMQSLPGKPNHKFFSEIHSLLNLFHMSLNVIKSNFEVTREFQSSKERFYPLPLNLLYIPFCNDFHLYLVCNSYPPTLLFTGSIKPAQSIHRSECFHKHHHICMHKIY